LTAIQAGKKEEKKEKIVEAARKVFSKYGYNKTTLDDIGNIVGMRKNSLYHYFSSKEEIFSFIINCEADLYFKYIYEEIAKYKSAKDEIKILIENGIKFGRKRLNLYNATVAARMEIFHLVENFHKQFVNKQYEIVRKLLREGIKNKEFVKHNSNKLAEDLVDMVNSIEEHIYISSGAKYFKEINFRDVDRKISNLLDLILTGLTLKSD
jgi:AcrR family transcriptional regulator